MLKNRILNWTCYNNVNGENTKTKRDWSIFLTEEVTNHLNTWLKYKHRTRRICYQNKNDDENNTKKL